MSRIITTLVIILIPFLLIGQDEVLSYAEQMPIFFGCEEIANPIEQKTCSEKRMYDYIYKNLIYPISAWENEIQGMVVVSFIVEKDGSLTEVIAVKDIGEDCGTSAIKTVSTMPKWKPAEHEGNLVRVRMNVPIKFGEGIEVGSIDGGGGSGLITHAMRLKRFSSKIDWTSLTAGVAKGNFDYPPNFQGCGNENEAASKKCTEKKLKSFFEENMVYPKLAWEKGYENNINVGFVISNDGSISDVKIYSELENESYKLPFDELTDEAKNLLAQLPAWSPAINKGQAVASYYFMPIQFDIIKYNRAQRKKQKKTTK